MLRANAHIEYADVLRSLLEPIRRHIKPIPEELFFFLEEEDKTGVYMPHGIADKAYHDPKRLSECEGLLYPGPLWRDKFVDQGVKPELIHLVGWPRLDPWFLHEIAYTPGDRPRVVWCPTHDAIPELSSMGILEPYWEILPDCLEWVSARHPSRSEDHGAALQRLADADVVLSDSSSCIYEALVIGKPVVLLAWAVREGILARGDTFEARLLRENLCYQADSVSDMLDKVKLALRYGIDDRTKKFIDEFYPLEFRGHSGEAAAQVLRRWS